MKTASGQNGLDKLATVQTSSVLLTDALHDAAQPLTVLAALLAEAGLAAEPALTGEHLAIANRECHRAIDAIRSLQTLAAPVGAVSATEGSH